MLSFAHSLLFYIYIMRKIDKLGDYEICYDTIIDHDVYQYLRVSLEVPRNTPRDTVVVVLNGINIGIIRAFKQGRHTVFVGSRVRNGEETALSILPSRNIGKIAAAIISDFVQ